MLARPTILFLKSTLALLGERPCRRMCCLLAFVVLPLCLTGCSDNIRTPTAEEMAAFAAVGSVIPTVDMELVRKAKLQTGPYRVVPGDVLEFTMPALLRAVTEADVRNAQAQDGGDDPFICRVSNAGTITLPAAGEFEVSGRSLAEIEDDAVEAYAPCVVRRPSIYARVLEYRTAKVYVTGAVAAPGVYTLQADQMTLVSLLTQAGGIAQTGAAVVRIIGSDVGGDRPEAVVRPVRSEAAPVTISAPSSPAPAPAPTAAPAPARSATIRSSVSGPAIYVAPAPPAAARVASQEIGEAVAALNEPAEPMVIESARGDASDAETPSRATPGPIPSSDTPVPDETSKPEEEAENRTIILPVVGMTIPFKDIALREGDTVVVEPIQMPTMSVLGLVRNPGSFAYPPFARYNLAQAVALAGGLAMEVEPRYVTIYRPKPDGSVLSLPFRLIDDGRYTAQLNEPVRPGDLVDVQNTPRTRTNAFINRFFRISVGTWIDVSDIWDNN